MFFKCQKCKKIIKRDGRNSFYKGKRKIKGFCHETSKHAVLIRVEVKKRGRK